MVHTAIARVLHGPEWRTTVLYRARIARTQLVIVAEIRAAGPPLSARCDHLIRGLVLIATTQGPV